MNEERIKYLLNEYYAGSSTLRQEQELREFFASEADVPEEFKADAAMFRAMNAAPEVPADLEQRIIDATFKRPRRRRLFLPLIAAAACMAVIITVGIKIVGPSVTMADEQPALADNYREVTDQAEAEAIVRNIARTLAKNNATTRRSLARIETAATDLRRSMQIIESLNIN